MHTHTSTSTHAHTTTAHTHQHTHSLKVVSSRCKVFNLASTCASVAKRQKLPQSTSLSPSLSLCSLLGRSAFVSLLALSTKLTVKIKTITHFYCCSSHESQIESEHRTKSSHSVLFSATRQKAKE